MAKWNCFGKVVGTKYLGEVDADTKEQALALAEELESNHVRLCHHCAEQCEDPEVDDITVEELG